MADSGAGEFRSTSDPKFGRITGNTFKGKLVRYVELGGVAVFEGDIALGPSSEIEARSREPELSRLAPEGVVITGDEYRWPKRLVPYQIDPALPSPERVREAIAHWQTHTAIRFVERTATNANQYRNYVLFTDRGVCWSQVGLQGGPQIVSLGSECSTGNAIHEIGHSVGLWHEQSRKDRDEYVTIHYENIIPGMEHNFDQHVTDGDDVGDYDYGSIMHYPATAFSKNDLPTIVAKNGASIGQRDRLSAGDIVAVKQIYP